MSLEIKIGKVEKTDIIAPELEAGASAIVFQRHERYERAHDAGNAGSLLSWAAEEARQRDGEFFRVVLSKDKDGSETMILFVASDTRYAGKGYRSIETAQVAQDAAVEVMAELGIDPMERIINFNTHFKTHKFEPTGQLVRPDRHIREPQIFEAMGYVDYLKNTYGDGELNPDTWAAHEVDAAYEMREKFGAESVYQMVERTKKSLTIMERYSRFFHANNPGKKLIIWAASHYDTISPFVKDATDVGFENHIPVDYGAGVVIELEKEAPPLLRAQGQEVVLSLGKKAVQPSE